MPPVEGARAEWQSPATRRPERSADARRLEAALDRISAALIRRAERDAEAADASRELDPAPPAEREAIDQMRHRLDEMIERVRTLLGDAAF